MTLYCAITLPLRLPLLNTQLRSHWSARSRRLKALAWEVKAALLAARLTLPPHPFAKAVVRVVRYSSNTPDDDGLDACVKPLLDVLQPLSKRNPCGLGIIVNDSPDCLTTYVEHRKAKAGDHRTDVTIEAL